MNRLSGKISFSPFPALLLLFVLTTPAASRGDFAPENGSSAWQQELLKKRGENDVEFKTSVTSPMAGRERLTVPAAEKTFILVRDGGVKVSTRTGDKAGAAFALLFKERKWFWAETSGVACRRGERPVLMDSEALAPGDFFLTGRITLVSYPAPDSLVLIVFDKKRREVLEFDHLLYYAPDPRYAVKARLEKFAEPQALTVVTTRKLEKQYYRYARVHFRLEGKDLELTALKMSLEGPEADTLFIPFKDTTNGKETYEVGRFLDVPVPEAEEFVLDFNRCYNPLCNYSPAYNCPLPPLENILDVAISAGEKAYPH